MLLSQHSAMAAKVTRQSRSARTDRSGDWLRTPGSVAPDDPTVPGIDDLLGRTRRDPSPRGSARLARRSHDHALSAEPAAFLPRLSTPPRDLSRSSIWHCAVPSRDITILTKIQASTQACQHNTMTTPPTHRRTHAGKGCRRQVRPARHRRRTVPSLHGIAVSSQMNPYRP
jgi:hypothetical protein